ncbi:hypothetical protein E1B28_001306 [Marasmius oreades]|uniref:Uncharacterized protein n=1 Tax=Marasmius oreades TaxID=181124 RepID=A0A9P7V363_9AGAR|nr:uncharacterized protein E1B28_001306 [Marasmius oreades]KAG7099455.1 hypothetical protein E1B28_001306 [Marasmius oreades]
MGIIFGLRPKESAWEVVKRRSVEPVLMYHGDEDLNIMKIQDRNIHRSFVFEVSSNSAKLRSVTRNAIIFARQQLLSEFSQKGYNTLMLEGWMLAIYKKEKLHRIEIQYTGRPAYVRGKFDDTRRPPFMEEVLADCLQT